MKKILAVLVLMLVVASPAMAQYFLTTTQLTASHNKSSAYYPIGTVAFNRNTSSDDTLGFRQLAYVKIYAGKAAAAVVKGSCLYDTAGIYCVSISPEGLSVGYDSLGVYTDSTSVAYAAPRVAGTAYAAMTSGYYGWMVVSGGAWVKVEATLKAGLGPLNPFGRITKGTPLCGNPGIPQLAKIAKWAVNATYPTEYKTYEKAMAVKNTIFGRVLRTYNDSTTLVKAYINCR